MPHATHPSTGLQALILCGPGVSLNTFTSNPKDFPKALVPIANRPMVWYPLEWCYRMGVNDITLITPPESQEALGSALKTNPSLTSLPSPKPEILAPKDLVQTTGTAELLRQPEVQRAVTGDFLILPCDFFSELEGSRVLQQWMSLNPLSLSSNGAWNPKGALAIFYPTQGLENISTKKDETDFLASTPLPPPAVRPLEGSLRSNIEQVVLNMPADTLKDVIEEDNDKSLAIRQALIAEHGRVKLRTKHRDAHVYVFPYWVKDFAFANKSFDSISEDLLGWWAKAGWQKGLASKLGLDESHGRREKMDQSQDFEGIDDTIDVSALSSTTSSRPSQAVQITNRTLASRVGSSKPIDAADVRPPPVYAYVQPSPPPAETDSTKSTTTVARPDQPIIRRIDTTTALLNISLYVAKQPQTHVLAHEHKIQPTVQLGQQSRVSQEDSLVAENVTVGMRVNIKESVIGTNCEIGANARLTRCLLMDGVVVGDGVQLTGCIIGRRAKIEGSTSEASAREAGEGGGEGSGKGKGKQRTKRGDEDADKTRLTDCEVAPGFVVEAGTQAKGEKMMAFDTDQDMNELDGTAEEDDGDDGAVY